MPEPVVTVSTYSPEETLDLGAKFGAAAEPGDVIALFGGLGAGKTVFAKGIMRGLGGDPAEVTSPTFTLMVRHEARVPLYHMDAYRLAGSKELLEIGVEEVLGGDGVSVIEWPERAEDLLPSDRLEVHVSVVTEHERRFRFQPAGARARAMIERAGLSA
jgi:tRNA threonylcarbamoyladenosine biosynthesis protein TsaE